MSAKRLLQTIMGLVFLIVVVLMLALVWYASRDRADYYPVDLQGLVIPEFTEHTIDFTPGYDAENTLPFTAGAVVDIDGDGIEELFFGGGINQPDVFYRYNADSNTFTDITAATGWDKLVEDKTFSAVSLDLDTDGDNDMLVTRQTGVFVYYNDAGRFSGKQLDLALDSETVPLSVTVADLNRDGLYDLYVSGYIAREHVKGETIFNEVYGGVSALFINSGGDTFDNVTEQAGLYYQHNTFQSMFVDVDNDGLEDLIVAHDTGQVRTWKNLGDVRFEKMPNPSSEYFSYPMGISITDLQHDGLPDFFFSNVGSTVPTSLVRGDLRDDQHLHQDWLMFENRGGFNFVDSAETLQLGRYEFGWGSVFEDFNLDGRDDLVVSENYVGWPLHKLPPLRLNGRFLLQSESGTFMAAGTAAKVRNRHYGIAPLTADFNQDGYPDLVQVNLLGPQKVFLSVAGEQGYLKVRLPNTLASIGAKVTVTLTSGAKRVQYFVVGEGLVSDQSHVLTFGLGAETATDIEINRLQGNVQRLTGSFRNEVVQP